MLSIDPKEISVPKLHHYLLGSVGPRPICFASTIDKNGVPNIAPFSFFNVFSANPPIAVFSPARSGRTNKNKDTFINVSQVPEVVINIVNYKLVHQMTLASSPYDSDINEFIKAGLTPVESELVRPFRIQESPVQMECKVIEIKKLGDQGGAGNLIICEVVKIHFDEAILDENQMVDQEKIDLVARMGGNWYCRANANSMFEIEKPITKCGVGFDLIPEEIRNSTILTGNDLGQLGGIESLPNETDVNEYKLISLSALFMQYEDDAKSLELELHQLAQKLLKNNKLEEAWMALLAFNN